MGRSERGMARKRDFDVGSDDPHLIVRPLFRWRGQERCFAQIGPPGEVGHLLCGQLVGIVHNSHCAAPESHQHDHRLLPCRPRESWRGDNTDLARARATPNGSPGRRLGGDLLIIPDKLHGLETLEDSAVLRLSSGFRDLDVGIGRSPLPPPDSPTEYLGYRRNEGARHVESVQIQRVGAHAT